MHKSFLAQMMGFALFWLTIIVSNVHAQTVVQIGISLPFTGANAEWTLDAYNTMQARWHLMKTCDPTTDETCHPLHPDLDIQFLQLDNPGPDSGSDPTLASSIASGVEANRQGLQALIGAGWSEASKGLAATAATFKLPVCDGSSTSLDLSNKADYPTFFRTTPDDSFGAEAIISTIYYSGWDRVALIASTDSFGSSLLEGARRAARDLNVTIVTERTFVSGTTDFAGTVTALRNSGATVFAFLGIAADMVPLLNEADKQGMITAGYQWIAPGDAIYVTSVLKSQEELVDGTIKKYYTPDALEQLKKWNGIWSVTAQEGHGPVYEKFLEYYQDTYRGGQRDATPDVYVSFFGACVESYAYAFSAALHNGISFDTLTLANYSFPEREGMTGKLALDEHGDRVGAYDVLFFNSSVGEAGEFVKFAEWDKTSAMSGSADNQRGGNGGINTFKTVEGQPVVYVGGVSEKPKATLQIFEALDIVAPGSGLGIFAILLCAICVLVLLGLMVIVSVQRNNPIFKATSPPFLLLTLLGALVGSLYPITLLGTPSKAACIGSAWLVPSALGLVLGSLLVKTLRLFYIFRQQGARKIGLQNKHMFLWLSGILGVYLIIVLVWTVVNPPEPVTEIYKILSPTSVTTNAFCTSSTHSVQMSFLGTLIGYTVLLLLISGFMAFVTRKLPPQFSEAKSLGYIIYAGTAILVFLLPILFMLDLSYSGYVLIKIVASYAAVVITTSVLFGNKCYRLWQERQARSNSDLLKGGLGKKAKDEMTDSWMVKTVVKTSTKSGTVWVLDKQSLVSYWAERTLILFADKHMMLLTGGREQGSSGANCQLLPLQSYEISTSSSPESGVYTIKLTHPKDRTAGVIFRVESPEEQEEWFQQLSKLCMYGGSANRGSGNPRTSVDGGTKRASFDAGMSNAKRAAMTTTNMLKSMTVEEEPEVDLEGETNQNMGIGVDGFPSGEERPVMEKVYTV